MTSDVPARRLQRALGVLLLSAIYCASARAGLDLAFVERKVTLIWPPTGIALAAVLVYGHRLVPSLVLAALIANLSTGSPTIFALATAIGNPLEAIVGAYLLRRFAGFQNGLNRVRDVLALVLLGAV